MPLEVARRKEEIEAIAEQVVYDKRAKQRKSSSKAAQSSMSNHIQSSMMTQQYPGMMMNYSAGMMVNGPTMMNSPMLMNHGHSMMMNSVPQVMMNAHHPGMINMRHSMAPNIMRKPLVPHLVYGTQGPYMMEQAPYGVSAPASHMSANAYPQQMTQQRMSAMKMTMQPTMMPYMQPMNMMQMMPMVQQPQYQHPGYGQPMQVVPQYWSQRGNGMQYKDQQSCTDEQYIGVGNMGYMEQ
ncbi:PHD-finger domain-containing protein protein, putative [Babesia ovis]|uniref:PHD-finger domain-containing protein protein, putative n=1 Tax=Babesia ovis TaxID=5869 RepID=A0A9W5TE35_BABOV|nr:PHD-finger domain-containing protein protein, putative [Babesia ovis]